MHATTTKANVVVVVVYLFIYFFNIYIKYKK